MSYWVTYLETSTTFSIWNKFCLLWHSLSFHYVCHEYLVVMTDEEKLPKFKISNQLSLRHGNKFRSNNSGNGIDLPLSVLFVLYTTNSLNIHSHQGKRSLNLLTLYLTRYLNDNAHCSVLRHVLYNYRCQHVLSQMLWYTIFLQCKRILNDVC